MKLKYNIHIFLFLNIILLTRGDNNPVLEKVFDPKKTWIVPRQITFLSHQMALRENGTTMMRGEYDNPAKQLRHVESPFAGREDRIFWRDLNYQKLNQERDLDEFTKHLLSKNAHRKLAYAGDEICKKASEDGVRFMQTYHEPLLPAEMRCYTCDRALLSSDNILSFHSIPSRIVFDANGKLIDFASRKEALSSELLNRYPLFGQLINGFAESQDWKGGDEKLLPIVQMLQYFGGSTSEIEEKYGRLVGEENLAWVQAPAYIIRSAQRFHFTENKTATGWKETAYGFSSAAPAEIPRHKRASAPQPIQNPFSPTKAKLQTKQLWRAFGNGKTVQCAREVNGNLVPLDVILNLDTVIVDDITSEWWKEYKSSTPQSAQSSQQASDTRISSYPYTGHIYGMYEHWKSNWAVQHPDANLKLEVSWESFSCCSACCCSVEMCGLYATTLKCENLRSTKTRKGYLSLMKIQADKQAKLTAITGDNELPHQNERYTHLNELLNRYPYNGKGIPVQSSMLVDYIHEPTFTQLLSDFEARRTNNGTNTENLLSNMPGIYVEEVLCDNDEQKKDCYKLAECKGIHLEKKKVTAGEVQEEDVCDSEDNLQILTITADRNLFRVDEGESYRFRIDSGVYTTTMIKWKISSKTVPEYDRNVKCGEQRMARHPDKRDLLFTKLTKEETDKRIEATLDNGKKLLILLNNSKETEKYSSNTTKIIIWGSIISGVVLLLMIFIVVVDRMRRRRIERVLQKKNRRLTEAPNETQETTKDVTSQETGTTEQKVK